ncbi:MAG: dihydropteroate synthase [Rhizobiales bacterium]|nr:dihydropteroate synthase [Hyphomicrobiales bacterium]
MAERVALVTGSLAEPRIRRIAEELADGTLDPVVVNIGVKVAALMTAEIVERRLKLPEGTDKVLMPGRFRGDLQRLAARFGLPFERGPEEAADLPTYFGRGKGRNVPLDRHDVTLFAEIVDATRLSIPQLLERARFLRGEGADVIDLGALPDQPFPHLEDAIAALKAEGFKVSVDSFDPEELRRGTRAGADYLLSLNETNLAIADEGPAVPVLVPAQAGDLASLIRAIEACEAAGRPFLADPILDPIHLGFTASLVRYAELRRLKPDIPILMGIGNVTELTDADTTGMNALLMGIISELRLNAVLAVQVSPHCRTAVREFDRARREYYAAREAGALPQGFGGGLMALRDRRPWSTTPEEVARLASTVADRNFRIEVTEEGIHVYNRDGHHVAADPFALFPHLKVEDDGAHAFYLGVETARAEIAHHLGKRYAQDEPLKWGVAGETGGSADEAHRLTFKEAGSTLSAAKKKGESA